MGLLKPNAGWVTKGYWMLLKDRKGYFWGDLSTHGVLYFCNEWGRRYLRLTLLGLKACPIRNRWSAADPRQLGESYANIDTSATRRHVLAVDQRSSCNSAARLLPQGQCSEEARPIAFGRDYVACRQIRLSRTSEEWKTAAVCFEWNQQKLAHSFGKA